MRETHAMRTLSICSYLLFNTVFLIGWNSSIGLANETIDLTLRQRLETSTGSERFHIRYRQASWVGSQTAVVVCDMWDLHHCRNATLRGAELVPRMNKVLVKFRELGAIVIHAPSSCTSFYEQHPARKHAIKTPRSKQLPMEIGQWCRGIPEEEKGKYPIDQSDGGEDDDADEHAKWAKQLEAMGKNPRAPWTRQTAQLTILDNDYISDNGTEIWSILEDRGITNVVLVGVHTNMCVLGRPFGLRNMARYGKNVVLMRDMTDTMYNPAKPPFVSHFMGTDLIVEHIEKWVCPTITSDQLIGGEIFRFAGDRRPHVVIAMAEREYNTDQTLPAWAITHLGKQYRVTLVHANAKERHDLPGIDAALKDADLLIVSVRRRALPTTQLAAIQRFIKSGKPVLGIRTASHAFSLRGKATPSGCQVWESFDADVIGGNYSGHHKVGVRVTIAVAKGQATHSILQGVAVAKLVGHGSLYQVTPLNSRANPLLIGTTAGERAEPIAWTNTTKFGGKAFYTSLGHTDDLGQSDVKRLLQNAVAWLLTSDD
jgi:nicotinamidase-related amidase/type 1 glutamine amidotransferase